MPEVGAVFGRDADRPRVPGDEVDLLLHGQLRLGSGGFPCPGIFGRSKSRRIVL